jgi:hypothetical protein
MGILLSIWWKLKCGPYQTNESICLLDYFTVPSQLVRLLSVGWLYMIIFGGGGGAEEVTVRYCKLLKGKGKVVPMLN